MMKCERSARVLLLREHSELADITCAILEVRRVYQATETFKGLGGFLLVSLDMIFRHF